MKTVDGLVRKATADPTLRVPAGGEYEDRNE